MGRPRRKADGSATDSSQVAESILGFDAQLPEERRSEMLEAFSIKVQVPPFTRKPTFRRNPSVAGVGSKSSVD